MHSSKKKKHEATNGDRSRTVLPEPAAALEAALARAIEAATEARRFDLVAELVRELRALSE